MLTVQRDIRPLSRYGAMIAEFYDEVSNKIK